MDILQNQYSTSKLVELMNVLKNKNNKNVFNYTVPDLWNVWNYNGDEMIRTNWGELIVNPFNFYYEVINSFILPKKEADYNYSKPINQIKNINRPKDTHYLGGDWIKESVVYSMMIRTSTSWDHDRSGNLDDKNLYGLKDTGTFVKTLALLPLLKKMGVDVVYMLPISKFSTKDKKGELGSPYGVSNFYELDPNLKDPITGNELTVEDEFQAFVEACHILGMKVMIDIIPRTNAIENELIVEHPEWFYWIKSDEFKGYFPPSVPTIGNTINPKPEFLGEVYKSEDVWKHIHKFSYDPKTLDSVKYKKVLNEYKNNPNVSFSDLVKREFNIQIAPAFSDQINDPQPPWTDITFFRMYEDHPILTQNELNKYLKTGEQIPPYILFDTIKNNFYQGNIPNKELWDSLSGIIPYYQQHFGIDGARIDMGHALSSDLLNMIITRARKVDPQFCFIAEELSSSNAEKARSLGYNMIIGDGFWHEPRYKDRTKTFLYNASKLAAPVFACGETHDTPRLASREGKRTLSKMLTIMNMFVPNAVPFINSGQEVYEVQPMNTGLDVYPNGSLMLDKKDPYFGKLALFDKYALHYLNEDRWDLPDSLEKVAHIRKEYLDVIINIENFSPIYFKDNDINCVGFSFASKDHILFIFANLDPLNEVECVTELQNTNKPLYSMEKLYSTHKDTKLINIGMNNKLNIHLLPGEVKIVRL
ncbi:MAG: alpha-amylase [Haloplasmataceae bacterium]|nr:alpha-amylase [Haloplasmataceae bacterium]